MSRAWRLRALPVAMSLVAACADTPTSPLEVRSGLPPGTGIDFIFPAFERDLLVMDGGEGVAEETRPARVTAPGEEEPMPEYSEEDLPDVYAAIYDPRTRAGFASGYAWAEGDHQYQGNKSRVETTLVVAAEGQQIGSQKAVRENDRTFILDFGSVKYISAFAKVYTNTECGLSASASSAHSAWWEAVIGGATSSFGRVMRTSYSDLVTQPACSEPPPPNTSAVYGDFGGGVYCWVSIWYDIYTGEVIRLDVLYCEGG